MGNYTAPPLPTKPSNFPEVEDLFLKNESTGDVMVLPGSGLKYLEFFIRETLAKLPGPKSLWDWSSCNGTKTFVSAKQTYFFRARAAEALGALKAISGIKCSEKKSLSRKMDSKGNHYINNIEIEVSVPPPNNQGGPILVVVIDVRDILRIEVMTNDQWKVIDPSDL